MMEDMWIETHTGKRVNPLHLTADDIDIVDIAHSLSLLCRYTGHCSRFYSVGQHSLHVAYLVSSRLWEDEKKKDNTCLAALLHDAAEAYLGDVARPLKAQLKDYREMEARAQGVIIAKYIKGGYEADIIKSADEDMLATEAMYLMPSKGEGWYMGGGTVRQNFLPDTTPQQVERIFLDSFWKYSK